MGEIVYLNGEFISKEDARIWPNDRGFLFADGVYEVAKYYNGKAFRYKDHLERLNRSLSEIGISCETDVLEDVFIQLIRLNKLEKEHAGIYLQITRGTAKRTHHFPGNIKPTVYAYAMPFSSATEKLEKGIKVITQEDIRWQRCDIKSVSLLPNTMLYNKAVEQGAGECVMVRNGYVTEATHSSVCAVKKGVLITRPLSNLILPGITRKVALKICATHSVPIEERLYTLEEFMQMDEAFISGTGSEITPIVQVDETIVGNGKPGAITRFIQEKFFEMTGK